MNVLHANGKAGPSGTIGTVAKSKLFQKEELVSAVMVQKIQEVNVEVEVMWKRRNYPMYVSHAIGSNGLHGDQEAAVNNRMLEEQENVNVVMALKNLHRIVEAVKKLKARHWIGHAPPHQHRRNQQKQREDQDHMAINAQSHTGEGTKITKFKRLKTLEICVVQIERKSALK